MSNATVRMIFEVGGYDRAKEIAHKLSEWNVTLTLAVTGQIMIDANVGFDAQNKLDLFREASKQ